MVPATMMRSAWRGVARGAEPKRSRSPRGPPVCISSMAQHAVPNSRYHVEFLRPQLSRSSTRVKRTPLFSIVVDIGLLIRVSLFSKGFTAIVISALLPEPPPVHLQQFYRR